LILRTVRRLLGLPAPRCSSAIEQCFVPMRDGVRLATWHVWPIDVRDTPGTVVIRTPYGVGGPRSVTGIMARLIAESGQHVIVQDVRGRYGSEGRFVPFVNERNDGADTLRWVAAQDWSTGRVGLFGASYLAYAAWCALAETPELVGALVSVIGSGDLYGSFYRGGALSLQNTFEWGLGVGERENVPERRLDLARGVAHRPLHDGDRVAFRTVGWLRDWVEHPRRDAYWQSIAPDLPDSIPPVLTIAGGYDFFLECQLRDHAALERAAAERGAPSPRLIIGPWAHGVPARMGFWRESVAGHALRAAIEHFDVHLCGASASDEHKPVRYFVPGHDVWHESTNWPPAESKMQKLFLHANDSRGLLSFEQPDDHGRTLHFRHDPEHPLPTLGGALFRMKAGIKDQRPLDSRSDVVVYDSAPLDRELTIAGPVRLCVHVESDAEDFDVTARLIDVAPKGRTENICDGIQRSRWRDLPLDEASPHFVEPGGVTRIEIDLGSASRTILAGHRLRVVVGASNFPRFDRNPGSRLEPALAKPSEFLPTEQVLHHDTTERSWLAVHLLEHSDAR
jgi:putative CocE/NonD family hydrolase